MRGQLWPDSWDTHARDVERFFSGQARDPLAALIAKDENGRALGFAELSMRPYAEGCTTDNVAFLEGWFVVPEARGRGVGRALVAAANDGRVRRAVRSSRRTRSPTTRRASPHISRSDSRRGAGSLLQQKVMKLYNELASWWPLMSPAAEYAEEAAFYRTTLAQRGATPDRDLLELGSGGGNNASHMKQHFKRWCSSTCRRACSR